MENSAINISGYDLLGSEGNEGFRFIWKYKYGNFFIESAAFPQRSTRINDNICGYTTSISSGCMLHSFKTQCAFCRTGNLLSFHGPLSYRDIAKQNIFMVLTDIYNKDNVELHSRPREFAYMGQGEPGLSYPQLRLAIEVTNQVMKKLGQSVYRHIFATSGIPEAIIAFKEDIKNYYTEKVTLHFSLHATNYRNLIMPIEHLYPYKEILHILNNLYDISGEKPCIGIMLFKNFRPNSSKFSYSNDFEKIRQILSELNPHKFRLSFCEYNSIDEIGESESYSLEDAEKVLLYAQNLGFEAKLFSSFGRQEQTACGMLGGGPSRLKILDSWIFLEKETDKLISDCN